MTWRVGVRPEAELDLLVAAGWYEAQRQGLGVEFIEELSLLVASLTNNALLRITLRAFGACSHAGFLSRSPFKSSATK